MSRIILASKSPRRQELIKLITEYFVCIPSNAPEIVPENTKPEDVAEILAGLKAKDIYSKNPKDIVIGCDTVVICNDRVLGKPESPQNAMEMLKMLSGNKHKVITGCCIIKDNKEHIFKCVTKVEFYTLTDEEIESYIESGEPFDKAGAYGIQGKGSLFVKGISGDYFNVVGLPVSMLARKLDNITKGQI